MKSALRMIAGHGGKDTGAVAGDLIERDLNIDVVLSFNDVALREYVPQGVTIVAIGKDDPRDGNQTLLDKIAEANAAGPDQLLIEVHHNVGGAGKGPQLWYSQRANAKPLDETWLVLPHLARELGFIIGEPIPQLESSRSRFGKLGILDDVECTAILVEARNVAAVTDPKQWTYDAGIALAKAMAAYFGWPRSSVPLNTPVAGVVAQDPRALTAFMLAACPAAQVDVAALASLYVAYGVVAGIRADVAIAQAIHETGRFTFPGTVKPGWNNYAGVGVTGPQAVQTFATPLDGVKAHIYHLRWYAYPDHGGIADCSFPTDPRHNVLGADGRHANTVRVVGDFGSGKWAPGAEYGAKIAAVLDELNAFVRLWTPPAPLPDDSGKLGQAKQIAARAAVEIGAL